MMQELITAVEAIKNRNSTVSVSGSERNPSSA